MSEPKRSKIFITHSWRDIEFARQIYKDLQENGFEVWLDDRAVQAGERVAGAIDRGLEWCDIYIPVLSYASLASPWCREEIEAAISLSNEQGRNGRPRIISLLIENCQDKMPALLRSRLFVNFTSGYEQAFKELLAKGFGSAHPAGRGSQPGGSQAVPPITHAVDSSEQAHCPQCGNFKLKVSRSYRSRSNGKPVRAMDSQFALIVNLLMFSFICSGFFLVILELDELFFFIIGIILFTLLFVIYESDRQKRFAGTSKRVVTTNTYECKNCGYQWQVQK